MIITLKVQDGEGYYIVEWEGNNPKQMIKVRCRGSIPIIDYHKFERAFKFAQDAVVRED